jgi:hypothetical protein
MKNTLLLLFLFWFSSAFAQQYVSPDGILNGNTHSMDSVLEERYKAAAKKYSELKVNEARLSFTLDSLEQKIKNEKDELLRARLDIILLLIKNEKGNDVYEKMREFGDKAVLDINKRVAAPAWFYKLDKEHAQYAEERKTSLQVARSLSNEINTDNQVKKALRELDLKSTPYDSLFTSMKLQIGDGSVKSFLTEVCKLYKNPVTTEKVVTPDYEIERIIVCGEKIEVFERKTFIWGGVFCFYDGKAALTEDMYISLSRESMIKALNWSEQQKAPEK